MNTVNLVTASKFLDELDLPGFRDGFESAEVKPQVDFDALKSQAMVAGAEVISFVKGVSVERRQDIINCALLAQLAANKKVPDETDVLTWYNTYFEVLTNLGWVIQEKGFASFKEKAIGLEAHQAIQMVANILLGPAPTALAVVTSTLEAMKSMKKDNPWITIFDRESRKSTTAKFQIALAEEDASGQFLVYLMAFKLIDKATLTQVLFFKTQTDEITFEHASGKVTINEDILTGIREKVRLKLIGRTGDMVDAIDLG